MEKLLVYSRYHTTIINVTDIEFNDSYCTGLCFVSLHSFKLDLSWIIKFPTHESFNDYKPIYPNKLIYRFFKGELVLLLSAKFDINMISNVSVEIIDVFANIRNVSAHNIYIDNIPETLIETFEYNLRKNKLQIAITV